MKLDDYEIEHEEITIFDEEGEVLFKAEFYAKYHHGDAGDYWTPPEAGGWEIILDPNTIPEAYKDMEDEIDRVLVSHYEDVEYEDEGYWED